MPSKKQPGTARPTGPAQKRLVASIRRMSRQGGPATKKQRLINLLSGGKPATAEKVSKTLDWQPHTVRAAITGLRKAGFVIDSTRGSDGSGTCYQIVSHPQSIEPAA